MILPLQLQVRFVDIDMMGHVNNAVYLSYFETARAHFFHQLLGKGWNWQKGGIILLKNEVEYLRPLRLEDEAIVLVEVEHIGNKSFSLSYRLEVHDELYTKGLSIMVAYDYTQAETREMPQLMREGLEKVKQEQ